MLETTWFVLWGLLWAVYFVLDGFDFGMGTLLPFLAKNDEEKRIIYNAAGPYWDGNEVWLITAGGVTFAAFPKGAEITKGFLPVGDDEELRSAQDMCRRKIADKHFAAGVSIMDPNNTYIDPRVKIGSGTVILPGTILRGRTVIGKNCTIGPNAMIRDCTVGDETEVNASQLNESTVGAHTTVGPFAYVRPNSKIGDHVKVGDFVEIKNSVIGNGTKISHLTYVGDSDCGERINFGCGTVTTNYDGFKKFRCTIGDDAFIGCNTNLIAPVTVGNGSYIAAGSTITDEVPADSLAIARERQVNKPGWAEQWRAAHEKK